MEGRRFLFAVFSGRALSLLFLRSFVWGEWAFQSVGESGDLPVATTREGFGKREDEIKMKRSDGPACEKGRTRGRRGERERVRGWSVESKPVPGFF